MAQVRCYHCGVSMEVGVGRGWVACGSCERWVEISIGRQWRAAEDVLAALRDPDLDPAVATELRAIAWRHCEKLKRRGLEAAEAKAAEPPPLPASAPIAPEAPVEPAPARRPVTAAAPPEIVKDRTGPSLWARLGPLFAENLLFALGGFLLLAGAVYLVTTAWTTMTGQQRLLVIAGGLELFAGLLYGAARLVRGREGLHNTERVLLLVTTALVPVALVAAGELALLSIPLALVVASVVLFSAWFPLRSLAGAEDGRLHPFFTLVFMALAAAVLLAPHLTRYPILAMTALSAAIVVVCAVLRKRVEQPPAPAAAWIAGSLAALAASVFGGDLALATAGQMPAGYAASPLGMLLAALGAGALFLERVGRSAGKSSVPVLAAAFALGITGVAVSTGDQRCLMVAAWLATATGIVLSLRLQQPVLLMPALGLSVVAYLFLPAPVRALALEMRDVAAGSLGYEPEALPLSFYGVTFAPYLAMVGILASVLRRAEKLAHARMAETWLLIAFLGLAAMSLVLGTDMRAPMAVLCADGLILLALGVLLRRELSVLLGTLGLYGSAVCGLVYLQPSPGLGALIVSGLALSGLGVAAQLVRGQKAEAFGYRAGRAVFRAVCLVSLGTVVWVGIPMPGLTGGGLDLPGFGLAAVLIFAVAGVLRQPLATVLAVPALVRAMLGGSGLLEQGLSSVWTPAALSLGMVFWLGAWQLLERLLPWRGPGPPADLSERQTGAAIGVGALLVQLAGVWSLMEAWPTGIFAWPLALGVATGALLLGLAGVLGRQGWCIWVSAFELALAGLLSAASLGFGPGHLAGSIGVAVAAILATLAPRLVGVEREPLRQGPTAGLVLGGLTGLWLIGARLAAIPDPLPPAGAWSVLNAALLLVGLGWLQKRQGEGTGALAGGLAATVLVLVPIAFLDLVQASGTVYPFAFLGTALLIHTLARRERAAVGLILAQTASALVVALAVGREDNLSVCIQLASFAGIALISWVVLRGAPGSPFTYLASLLLFLGLSGAVCVDIAHGLLSMPPGYQMTLLLALGSGYVLAAPRSRVTVSRAAALTIAVPAFLLTAVTGSPMAFAAWTGEPLRGAIMGSEVTSVVDMTALAFVGTSVVLGLIWRNGFWLLLTSSLVLTASVTAPINGLLEWGRASLWRPDVECAAIGALIAGVSLWRNQRARATAGLTATYFPVLLGLLLTAGELGHVSTPLTLLVATAVPLLVLRRTGSEVQAGLHGLGVLITAWAWTIYLSPESELPPLEILPVLGLEAAALGWLLPLWGKLAAGQRSRRDRGFRSPPSVDISSLALVVALACVAINAVFLGLVGVPAGGWPLTLGVLACVLVAGKALAMSRERAGFVHVCLLAILAMYAFVALRTDWLSVMDGHHQDTLIIVAMTLFLAAGQGNPGRRRELLRAAKAFPILSMFGLLFASPGGRTVTLFLIAATYGLASLTARRRPLGLPALLFLNLALFSLWLNEGIFDPSFYGVPMGVSILLVTEVARRQLHPSQTGALRFCGLAVLYGSVAIQILRVEEPFHALVLFALGLISVIFGFLRERNDLVLAGTIAVVIDVIAYLAVHGLEQGVAGPFLLIASGATVLTVATLTARRRAQST